MTGGGRCEECGGRAMRRVADAQGLLECELCGALAGDDAAVHAALLAREAREHGVDPAIYPLVLALDKIPGLRVARVHGGDPRDRTWPFVQVRALDGRALVGIENLVKSLALAATASAGPHWVVEAEFAAQLVFTLKPRFHRDPDRIDAAAIDRARRDLARLAAVLERDMRLSWWRR